jgi:NADH dehydrogenase
MTAIPATKLVTVFGGSGFLGRHIVRALANDGWRIRVAVRYPNLAHFLKPMGRVGQIQIVKANIRSDDAVLAAVMQADAVVNLVGILSQSGDQRFEALHAQGAGRIARIARAHGVERLLHVSAIGADTESPSLYGRTKAEGEMRVREGFPSATIFRPSIVFGPQDNFFNKFGWLARMSPVLPLIGGGTTRFQPVFAGDIARAAAQALKTDAAMGQTYELGGPEILTFRQILEIVLKQTNRRRMLLPLPFGLAKFTGAILGLLPGPLLTLDQVRMLERDNVVSENALTLQDLGIMPTAAEAVVPSYLWRFRRHGEFETVLLS